MKDKNYAARFNMRRMNNTDTDAVADILKLISDPTLISFGGGLPAPETFPAEEIAEIAYKMLKERGATALQYGATAGVPSLLQKILARTGKLYGGELANKTQENITMTSGSQQALDLIGKVFLDEGDIVFVEKPTYLAALNAFQTYMAKFVGIEMDDEGIVVEDFKAKLAEYPDVKLLYTIPDFQNPTGRVMSLERRKALLEAAKESGIMILEDNPYGELRYTGETLPPLAALDPDGQVIYMGTFSKIFCPGTRLGYTIAPKEVIDAMVAYKSCQDLSSNIIAQHIVDAFMDEYPLEPHVAEINKLYGHRREVVLKALDEYMPDSCTWTKPEGGLFLWITFPEGVDSKELLEIAAAKGVGYVPGEPFYDDGSVKNNCRINFSYVDDETLIKGVKALADATKEYLAK